MPSKKKAFIVIFVIVLTITACAAVTNQQQAASGNDQGNDQGEVLQFIGMIGESADYSVYRMTDGNNVCYIVLDEFVAPVANSNSAPAIHCP